MLPQDNFQKLIQYQSMGEMFIQDEETFPESVKVMQLLLLVVVVPSVVVLV